MNKIKSEKQTAFETRIQQALDEQLLHLDSATLSRLHQARQQAIEITHRRSWIAQWWLPTIAAGVTAALVASIGLAMLKPNPNSINSTWLAKIDNVEDVEMLSANEDLEFYEGLEFLLWLDESGYES